MKRLTLMLLALACIATSGLSLAAPGPVHAPNSALRVDLWPDRGDGAVYEIGDNYNVYFRPTDDCFVTIYEIDTDGNVIILFPSYPDDGWVFGGMTYRLPDYYGHGYLRADGPRGIAYVHAIATRNPQGFIYPSYNKAWYYDGERIGGDPFVAINTINARITAPNAIEATSTVTLFIGGHVWYPRYSCNGCHSRATFHYDPYDDVCPRYTVVTANPYDYWWDHTYYPVSVGFVFGGPFWRFELRTGIYLRHRHDRYVNCAFGFGNYYPLIAPRRPFVYHPRFEPPDPVFRGYQRGYTVITYDRSRHQPTGPGITRTRSAATMPAGTASRERTSGPVRDRQVTTSPGASRDRSTAPSATTRERTTAPSATTRERSAAPSATARERSASAAPTSRERTPSTAPAQSGNRSIRTPGASARERVQQPSESNARVNPNSNRQQNATAPRQERASGNRTMDNRAVKQDRMSGERVRTERAAPARASEKSADTKKAGKDNEGRSRER
jgi:hypothetical protein